MSNTHLIPDAAAEGQAIMGDLQAPCILSTTWPAVPVTSLTLAAFATHGYVVDGTTLKYVDQAAAQVTLTGADGQFWVALHKNTWAAVASWTRQVGTHYLWRSNATKPANPPGGLILSQVTVAGGIITAVSQTTIPTTPMSLQDAGAVAITGGSAAGLTITGGSATGLSTLSIQSEATSFNAINVTFNRSVANGCVIQPNSDVAGGAALLFLNTAAGVVGSIATTGTTTAYNTSSDARLKFAIATLTGTLDAILALRPVAFRWQADGSPGHGFVAHELQEVLPDAVTGEPDAVDAQGGILPQQVDHSKLVVWLVGAVQELATRVAELEAQLA